MDRFACCKTIRDYDLGGFTAVVNVEGAAIQSRARYGNFPKTHGSCVNELQELAHTITLRCLCYKKSIDACIRKQLGEHASLISIVEKLGREVEELKNKVKAT